MLDGVEFIGTGSVVSRMWTQPAISVIGIDVTPVNRSSNTLIPAAKQYLVKPQNEAVQSSRQ